MALNGFLEAIEAFQVRGWVHDSENPGRVLTVEILLHGRTVGTARADLHRVDLDRAGIGDHAFIYNFGQKLSPSDIMDVSVRVTADDGSLTTLRRVASRDEVVTPPKPQLRFEGVMSDSFQHPVFVMGAARSGTSAMAQALLKLSRFEGYQEGHLLDLLAHLSVCLTKFYNEKGDERLPDRDTAISLVPREYFDNCVDEIFIRTVGSLFPEGRWIDKTPNSNMIHLAPRFRAMWPNSRFIFMKRRFLENAVSRAAKFPGYSVAQNCQEWNEVMTAWLSVRAQLHGAAIEVDQRFLSGNPDNVSEALKRFLNLTDVEKDHIGQAFKYDHPERTSPDRRADLNISDLGWPNQDIRAFERYCAETMGIYGYSTDSSYYLPGQETGGLVWI